MPIAMNFDLLSNKNDEETYERHLDIKLTKSPLSNGTNRQLLTYTVPSLVKQRTRPIVNRITRNVNLEQLSRCTATNRICLPNAENEKWSALAISNEYILVGGGSSSTLRLFDLKGNQIRLLDIKTFGAFDLAWSNVLNAFLIAGYDRLQTYNVVKDQLTQIENINLLNRKDNYFWSIACHGNDIFIVLSDGLESVWRLSLPSFIRIQTLSGSEIRECNSDDRISCIRTNGFSIGMTLRQRSTKQWRVDLFDYTTMKRTHRGLTIGCGVGDFNFIERCMLAPVDDHKWLIIGGYKVTPNALTLMNDQTGEVKQVERQLDQEEEFISNICTSETSQQEQIITMIIINNLSGQRQMHVMQS